MQNRKNSDFSNLNSAQRKFINIVFMYIYKDLVEFTERLLLCFAQLIK